ncbi:MULTISPECIES: GNAT family N-acyltransferase [Alphaproteobacteria]|uniref:N-acetyltransferase domain-containing protein n=2 Tax=Alphaproteobacteria TaxID=28211 RepID=A0A512HM03_9HYPH|nr:MULTISPECIES: GNAT family N-acyltransferase [Alphaproteobacteria]GEO86473.1 hypothetical protein RNA01_34050 [Ciceribacter naphthalenivorans]GLR23830.1 hypothetical protein GCM10007920_36220 [Ciceribacter naphthalenivorans]GLT06686.1 hypothetical protein GCM10007926_36220 [Sphingomonas psychrolutea]
MSQDSVVTRLANTEADMLGVTSLWRTVYGNEFGWLSAQADPYNDGFHDRSTYYVAWLNDALPIGTMRIVKAHEMGFHITDAVDVRTLSSRQPKVVEVQRLMVMPDFRDKRFPGAPFGVYGCMVKACLHHAIANGIDVVLADCHRDMTISPLKSMKQMGFIETGDTYVDSMNGLVCVILTIDTKTWLRNIYTNQNNFNRYLLDIGEWSVIQSDTMNAIGLTGLPIEKEHAHA